MGFTVATIRTVSLIYSFLSQLEIEVTITFKGEPTFEHVHIHMPAHTHTHTHIHIPPPRDLIMNYMISRINFQAN